jgi:hypothetical protein
VTALAARAILAAALVSAVLACGGTDVPRTTAAIATALGPPPSMAPTAPPSPTPSLVPNPSPTRALTREEAVARARQFLGERDGNEPLLTARLQPFGALGWRAHVSPAPGPSTLVWVINFGEQPSPTGGQGWYVVLDAHTGEVVFSSAWVS